MSSPYARQANTLFSKIIADLEKQDGAPIVAALLGDSLRNWSWHQACAGMIAGNKNRHSRHADQPESD